MNNKKILYLAQSRDKFVDNVRQFENHTADVIILTFESDFNEDNFIYLPNSNWYEGRNALYEQAISLKKKYDYYVFIDDDIKFLQASQQSFDNDLIASNAQVMVPRMVYQFLAKILIKINRLTQFHYSKLINFDMLYVAFSREVFYNKKIFPWNHTQFMNLNFFSGNFIFKFNLFLHCDKNKILVNNFVLVDNLNHASVYKEGISTAKLVSQELNKYFLNYATPKQLKTIYKRHFYHIIATDNVFFKIGYKLRFNFYRLFIILKQILVFVIDGYSLKSQTSSTKKFVLKFFDD